VRAALVAAVLTLGACVGLAAAAADPEQGKLVFERSCGSCHTLGGGDTVGPDLQGVTERRDPELVRRFIAEPDKLIAEGDPEVTALVEKFGGVQMPNLGLPAADVDAVVAYLETQGGAAAGGGATTTPATETGTTTTATETAPETVAPAGGDAATGEKLFTGEEAFSNGGAACISCHAIAGDGALGGGRVGPDLTGAYTKYGGATGVPRVLETLPFPTMVPVYEGQPLTKEEAAHLAAFLETTAGEEPSDGTTWLFVVLGAGVATLLLALALLVWPRRRLVVRRRLVSTSTSTRRV
jgi:mono/diheme cytochrome c family protein